MTGAEVGGLLASPTDRLAGGPHAALLQRCTQQLCHGRPVDDTALDWCRPELIDGLAWCRTGTGALALEVFVAEGWPLAALPARLPSQWGSLPLRRRRRAPFRLQLGRVEIAPKAGGAPLFGSLGFLATDAFDPAALFAVSAGHVLGADLRAAFDDPLTLRVDRAALRIDGARLAEWATPLAGGAQRFALDAGLVRLSGEDLHRLVRAEPRLVPPDLAVPRQGLNLNLLQADGSPIAGVCGLVQPVARVEIDVLEPSGAVGTRSLLLERAHACRLSAASLPGDSGAPLHDATTGGLLGIHCAFAPQDDPNAANALFTPVQDIAAHFEVTPLTQATQAQAPASRQRGPLAGAKARPAVIPPAATGPQPRPAPSDELDTLARTLWAEARGEGRRGMEAVACVVQNRVAQGGWWGNDIVSVCRKPWQFSCWNPGTRSLEQLLKVDPSDPHFALAREVAASSVDGKLLDFTRGARHYHTIDVQPAWARGRSPCFTLGRHIFFNSVQ